MNARPGFGESNRPDGRISPKRIGVVGAGLGGLAAAIALRAKGHNVRVFERSNVLGEVGAGIQITPNAVKVLRALGVEKEIVAAGFQPNEHVVRNFSDGRPISRTVIKGAYQEKYGAGFYGIHRADFHSILASRIPSDCIQLSSQCVGVEDKRSGGKIHFENGTSYDADVVVGADGIHSAVRRSIIGADSPRYTGIVCWRGLTPVNAIKPALSHDVNIWYGPHALIIAYHVRGGELVNWAATIDAEETIAESWRGDADPADVVDAFRGWDTTVQRIVGNATTCFKSALYDRDPLKFWSKASTTLLGDAAHPMLPYLAQGAGTAVEDGYALAEILSQASSIPAAFERYEELRRNRTGRIQLNARGRGRTSHLASPVARFMRNMRYRWQKLLDPASHTYKVEWIHGYDITSVLAESAKSSSPA